MVGGSAVKYLHVDWHYCRRVQDESTSTVYLDEHVMRCSEVGSWNAGSQDHGVDNGFFSYRSHVQLFFVFLTVHRGNRRQTPLPYQS
jgi:hypothetical protein